MMGLHKSTFMITHYWDLYILMFFFLLASAHCLGMLNRRFFAFF